MVTRATIDVGYVAPNQSSRIQLSMGTYSLSARSNVPFVSLIGASGFVKVFSWGETVEVPCGQTCTVKNVSYHGGDIFINAGADFDNCPARITVPVIYATTPDTVLNRLWPEFPADVRRARRAYLYYNGQASATDLPMIVGIRSDGSHRTADYIAQFTSGQVKGVGYVEFAQLSGGDLLFLPLGNGAIPGDNTPHVLLTTAAVLLPSDVTPMPGANPPGAYYTLEY